MVARIHLRRLGAFCLTPCLALCSAGPLVVDAFAATQRSTSRAAQHSAELSPWEQAEHGRDALEDIPAGQRTRTQYTHAMDGYRAIYHANPADGHAAAAVNAVAELLAEQGRAFHEAKSLQSAVAQYEFLRKQYPRSSLGVPALLAEAQIEQNDLKDPDVAKEKYAQLLHEHPKSELAEEARAGIASLEPTPAPKASSSSKTTTASASTHRETTPAQPTAPAHKTSDDASILPPMPTTSAPETAPAAPSTSAAARLEDVDAQTRPASGDSHVHRIGSKAVVTGIRHWSTSTYTRVAIDLGDNVTYEAARVPNPDRIYFDLHSTRLAQELVGKSFAVTDDGFLKKIRAAQFSDDMTRVVLDVSDVSEYSAFLLPNPYRLIIDIHGKGQAPSLKAQSTADSTAPAAQTSVKSTEVPAPHAAGIVDSTTAKPVPNTLATRQASSATDLAAISDVPGRVEATSRPTSRPISAVVPTELDDTAAPAPAPSATKARRGTKPSASAPGEPARAAVPTADGETSLIRALGLKIGRIVIDAGHGGHDSGTIGADGIQEKDVVLDVALRVGKLLHDRLGAEIIYTRSNDTFIPLETRTAIANKAQADLFLSIHANSSADSTARGVETYYLNFTSDASALETAARENAVSDQSIHQLSDLVKKIALKDKIEESREFATDVESSLYSGLARGNDGLRNRGVKKAPFVVLIGANMPSILAEISFVTNPKDASQLRDPEYRGRVAESLYRGVARYEGGLSATHPPTERAQAGQ